MVTDEYQVLVQLSISTEDVFVGVCQVRLQMTVSKAMMPLRTATP